MNAIENNIIVTPDFLEELIAKSWAESESVQYQINAIDTSTEAGKEVASLLKMLLANQYVFIGCLENLASSITSNDITSVAPDTLTPLYNYKDTVNFSKSDAATESVGTDTFEPFEYFVDFDEPVGSPLSDEDLYG